MPHQHQFDGVGVDAFGEASGEVCALEVADLAGYFFDDLVDAYGLLKDALYVGKQRVGGVGTVELPALRLGAGDHARFHQPAQLLADGIVALPEVAFHFTEMALGAAVQEQFQ